MKIFALLSIMAMSLSLPACQGSPGCQDVAANAVVVVRNTAKDTLGDKSYDELRQASAALTKGIAVPGGDLLGLQESTLYNMYFNMCDSGQLSATKKRCLVGAKTQAEFTNCMLSDVPGFGPDDLPK